MENLTLGFSRDSGPYGTTVRFHLALPDVAPGKA
jgi:hypothetical protein